MCVDIDGGSSLSLNLTCFETGHLLQLIFNFFKHFASFEMKHFSNFETRPFARFFGLRYTHFSCEHHIGGLQRMSKHDEFAPPAPFVFTDGSNGN